MPKLEVQADLRPRSPWQDDVNPILVEQIRSNYRKVQEVAFDHLSRKSRTQDDLQIIVVSKGQNIETIQAAIQAGIHIFGENYAEEAEKKIMALGDRQDLEWHMIGHVQSKKVRKVCPNFKRIHSIDSLHIAEIFETQLSVVNKSMHALLEFNIAGESSKSGWNAVEESCWEALQPELQVVLNMQHLLFDGIMVMPPISDNPEASRPYFQKAARLSGFLQQKFKGFSWQHLSMGTSLDYGVAIEEGATMVRIGQAVLGARQYNKVV